MLKKWLSALLVTIAIVVCCPFLTSAASDDEVLLDTPKPYLFAADVYNEVDLSQYVDVTAFRSYLMSQFRECKTNIDLTQFNIPAETNIVTTICNFIWYQMPEAFHFHTTSVMYNRTTMKITAMAQISYYTFADTASEYEACWNEFDRAAEKMLYGIEGNMKLSAVDKALLLHDRLAVWTEYDTEGDNIDTVARESFTAYGVFAKRVAVCQGYALAYDYLLERVGIRSDLCPSFQLNHIWNIVYINNTPYHVDVTWDDPVEDVTGRVSHTNFLRSSNAMYYDTGHEATDYDKTPQSTAYDNAYWQKSRAEFQLVGNTLYYMDHSTGALMKSEAGTRSKVYTFDDQWNPSYAQRSAARLDSIGGELLISGSKSIYAYDTVTGTKKTILVSQAVGSNMYIYGFTYENGMLIYDMYTSENYATYTKKNHQYTSAYYGTYVKPSSIKPKDSASLSETCYIGDTIINPVSLMVVTYTDGSTELVLGGFTFNNISTATAGKKEGTLVYGSAKMPFNVSVKTPSIKFDKRTVSIDCSTYGFTPVITTQPPGQAYKITSSNADVAYILGDLIMVEGDGEAKITASFTYNGIVYKDTCTITANHAHDYEDEITPADFDYDGFVISRCRNCGEYGTYTTIPAIASVKLSTTEYTYNGSVRKPNVTVKDIKGKTLTKDKDYTVTYPSGRKNAGTYRVKVTFKGRYKGNKTVSFIIKPISSAKCTFKLSSTAYTYNGAVRTPSVTVKNANGTKLAKNTHYTVTYASGRKNTGTYKVTIKMKGNYSGTKTLSFKINPISISKCTVKLSKSTFTYNGSTRTLPVVVKNGNGTVLTKGTHYTVHRVTGGKNAGSHEVLVKMKGNYSGSKTLKYTIKPISISKCTVKITDTTLVYTGKPVLVPISVKNANGTKLTKNTHFTVKRLTGGTAVGQHKVLVTMKGNYSGSKTLTYKILPAATAIRQLAIQGNKLTVDVNKRTAQVSGYQIQHAAKSSFSDAKTVTKAGNKNARIPVTVSTKKGTYYVRVRTYKDVKGTRYYSAWTTYSYTRY